MDRTDVTPDRDELLETALTDPESFDAARTTRLVAQLEHDDAEVQRAASWALRFVASETPSLVDADAGRFRRALREPEARPVVLRTLAVLAEHNQEAVADIIDGGVEATLIDELVGQRIVAGYQPPELDAGGSVIADDGDETVSPTETAAVEEGREQAKPAPDEDSSPTPGYPPDDPQRSRLDSIGRSPTTSPTHLAETMVGRQPRVSSSPSVAASSRQLVAGHRVPAVSMRPPFKMRSADGAELTIMTPWLGLSTMVLGPCRGSSLSRARRDRSSSETPRYRRPKRDGSYRRLPMPSTTRMRRAYSTVESGRAR